MCDCLNLWLGFFFKKNKYIYTHTRIDPFWRVLEDVGMYPYFTHTKKWQYTNKVDYSIIF